MRLIQGIIYTMDWDYMIPGQLEVTASRPLVSPSRPPSQRYGHLPIQLCVKPHPHPVDLEANPGVTPAGVAGVTMGNNINNRVCNPLIRSQVTGVRVAEGHSAHGPTLPTLANLSLTLP